MAKYLRVSEQEKQELLEEFCEALSVLKNSQEIMNFLTDLLTKQETIMLAKRIKIAKLLIDGQHYREIEDFLKVSHSTVARVGQWLMEAGEGFRIIAQRTKKAKPKPKDSLITRDWRKFKRHYPLMFWPELLIEDIIGAMNQKQKEKVRSAIRKLDRKSKLYKQINKILAP